MRIAIIGAGISGLSCAYFLHKNHEITIFEKDSRIGGHTNTIVAPSANGPIPIDTGFIVHNARTYPLFCKLMAELGVATQASDMSFGVTSEEGDYEYSSRGAAGIFAQARNLVRPRHYSMIADVLRFNREARDLLGRDSGISLDAYVAERRYGTPFIERYLYPMASAIWSTSLSEIGRFPAVTLVRFFDNHGLLGIDSHPQWMTIRGGSNEYLAPLTAGFRDRIRRNRSIRAVVRSEDAVKIVFDDGRADEIFDQVVFACHGDQILPILPRPTELEKQILSRFFSTPNEACLHTDERMLPKRKGAWASWNYRVDSIGPPKVTYHMNRLQSLAAPENFCVSLNVNGGVSPDKVIRRIQYSHPLYTQEALTAQQRWSEISGGRNRTHYCGAYWFYGFHEDGVKAALRVARSLGSDWAS